MAFKRIGNETLEWLQENSCHRGYTGRGRETRAELECTTLSPRTGFAFWKATLIFEDSEKHGARSPKGSLALLLCTPPRCDPPISREAGWSQPADPAPDRVL